MASGDLHYLNIVHIKNKLMDRAAELVNSRNPALYFGLKPQPYLHYAVRRDLKYLIQDG